MLVNPKCGSGVSSQGLAYEDYPPDNLRCTLPGVPPSYSLNAVTFSFSFLALDLEYGRFCYVPSRGSLGIFCFTKACWLLPNCDLLMISSWSTITRLLSLTCTPLGNLALGPGTVIYIDWYVFSKIFCKFCHFRDSNPQSKPELSFRDPVSYHCAITAFF